MGNWSVKLEKVKIPFKGSYEHHLAKRNETDSTFLFIEKGGYKGFAEACPRAYVSGESFETIKKYLDENLTNLLEQFEESIESIEKIMQSIPQENSCAKCLVEAALLTFLSNKKSKPIHCILGIDENFIINNYSATYDATSDEQFSKMIFFFKQMKMNNAKLKIDSSIEKNILRIKKLKEVFGNELSLRMDGNEIYTFSNDKEKIRKLIDEGIKTFEQPFKREDIESHKAFHKEFGKEASLIIDEGIITLADAQKLLSEQYVSGINLKISKNGGLFNCLKIANLFSEKGKTVRLGCHVGETSLLAYFGAIFCHLFPSVKDKEGCFSTLLLEYDPVSPNLQIGPEGRVHLKNTLPKYSRN